MPGRSCPPSRLNSTVGLDMGNPHTEADLHTEEKKVERYQSSTRAGRENDRYRDWNYRDRVYFEGSEIDT